MVRIFKISFLNQIKRSLGDLLERLCYKTEFEVEGWRKILPLIEMLEKYIISSDDIARMKLEMKRHNAFISEEQFRNAWLTRDMMKFGWEKIRDSWIYKHFKETETKNTKIILYVSSLIDINQFQDQYLMSLIENHCVLVKGIQIWNDIECFEIENFAGSQNTKFIPVDQPFLEEVVIKHKNFWSSGGPLDRRVDKYFNDLARIKWGKQKISRKEIRQKKMTFIQGRFSCFQLKFKSS